MSLVLRRFIYYGALNGPQVKFVPVSKAQRPPLFTMRGLSERIFRVRMTLRTIVGLYQLWKLTPRFGLDGLRDSLVKVYEHFLSAVERGNKAEILECATLCVYESLKGRNLGRSIAATTREFVSPPRLVSIVPVQVQGTQKIRVFQVTLCLQSGASPSASGAYIVFEYCPDVFDPRWRVCGQVYESDEYYRDD